MHLEINCDSGITYIALACVSTLATYLEGIAQGSLTMATAFTCTKFPTPFISNTCCTRLSSRPTSFSASKCYISLPKAKIYFKSKYPIGLTRTIAYLSFEGNEEMPEEPQGEEDGGAEEEKEGEMEEDVEESEEEKDVGEPGEEEYAGKAEEEEEGTVEQNVEEPEEGEGKVEQYVGEPEEEEDTEELEFNQVRQESELEIVKGYEALYGPAYSGISVLGNNVDEMDERFDSKGIRIIERIKDDFEEVVVQVRRVTKVVKGGRYSRMRTVVVVGNRKGKVGVGVGKATDLAGAMQKAGKDARRSVVSIHLTNNLTFPHRAEGHFRAAKVMLRPAPAGSGVSAGGAVRLMLELAGIKNGLGKQLGCDNALNNCRAVLDAFSQMRTFQQVSELRGIPVAELLK